ncbi:MAG: peroxiredoxin family protein [Acidimicrobiia bacterium]
MPETPIITPSTPVVEIGSPIPEFRAPSSHGQTLGRDSFVGKVDVVVVFPPETDARFVEGLQQLDERLVEFGHRRTQVLAVVPGTARMVRDLADEVPIVALTLLADEDGSIREAFGARGGQCFLADEQGALRAVVPYGGDVVDDVLRACDTFVTADDPGGGEPEEQPPRSA